MPCFSPSELVNPVTASAFGLVAESFISVDYLKFRGKTAFFPASTTDFRDISVGFGNTVLYIAFLSSNNPHLSKSALLALSAAGLLKIPDLITDDGLADEFYEIKPNSITGRLAGVNKIAFIHALYLRFSVPYIPGLRWRVNKRFTLFDGIIMGAKVKVTFHHFQAGPGLVLYELCIDGELAKLALHILIAILVIIILVLIGKGAIRPVPQPLPA